MTGLVDPSGLSRLLADTMAALDDFQQQSGDPPTGEGSGADGLITVHTALPGRVTEIALDPRAMRLTSDRLADELTSAVNAALADLQSRAGVPAGAADFGALGDRLREIQETTGRQLNAMTTSLVEAQEMLARRAGGAG